MKEILQRCLLMVCLMMLVVFKPTMALAKTTEQDNLKVKFEVEQVQNSSDQIKGTVKVTNIGVRPIEGINIQSVLPNGIKLKDANTLTKEIGTLEAGASISYEFYGELESSLIPDDDGNSKNPSNDNNGDSSNSSKDDTTTISNGVNTGDDNIILGLILLISVCGGLIILLSKKKVKKVKKVKSILSVFICLTLVATLLQNTIVVKASENQNKEISVHEDISIDGKIYSIETIVSYKIKPNEVQPSGEIISRGEWISRLVDTIDLKGQQQLEIDEFEFEFNDIEGHEYEEDILYAIIYSILDIEEDTFRPDEPATREFAAVTAVKALGFNPIQNIICDDSNEITYLKEVETAIEMDIINLDKNKFYPSRSLTQSEAEYVLEGVMGILKSFEINTDYDSVIEYKEGVIELDYDILYAVNQSIVTLEINDNTKNLKKDDIFVLPDQTPYKVVTVMVEGNNVIVETIEPKIEETLQYLDVQGYGTIDRAGFIPAEGVELVQADNPTTRAINVDEGGSISGPGTINLSVKKKIDSTMELNGSVAFSLPKISYKADIDLGLFDIDVNNAYLKFESTTKLIGNITVNGSSATSETKDGLIELGKVPIVGVPGVAIYAQVALAYSLEGKISVVYSLSGDMGAQVLNNRLRAIKTLNSKLDTPVIEVTGKLGPKISGLLEICRLWDLIDFSANAGGAATATLTPRPTGMLCVDANFYVYADLSALDIGVIGKWLNLKYTWSIWNKGNSPFNKKFHFENLNTTPQCTFGSGVIKGTVAEAGNRTNFIKNVLIQVYDTSTNRLIKEVTTDENGQYSLNLKSGNYRLKILKDGYISFESIESLSNNEEKYVETYLIVGQGQNGEKGTSGGEITNALTGRSISDVAITARKGWNNLSGDVIQTTSTNQDGKYEVNIPLGNYTIQMIKEGYISNSYNIYVTSGTTLNQNNTLVPDSSVMPTGDLRIVLTWDEQPRDLDSHLVGPTADGSNYFHIYYGNKSYSQNGIMYGDLDLDDTTSYGPETTTVYNMNSSGKYSFYVHDYTNRNNSSSDKMSNSGGQVKVYKGDALYAVYSIPTNNVGTYWKVFDYDAGTNTIIPVNKFVDGIRYGDANFRGLSLPKWGIEEKIAS